MQFSTDSNACNEWNTRERSRIDRIACPWLIKHFADKDAEFIYVPAGSVKEQAKKLNATPFDVPDVEFSHYDNKCTFVYELEEYNIKDPALHILAIIVRGADTDRFGGHCHYPKTPGSPLLARLL